MIFQPSHWILCVILFSQVIDGAQVPNSKAYQFATDCGSRPARRQPRNTQSSQPSTVSNKQGSDRTKNLFQSNRQPKIIAGLPTKDGQFPWQASLELLHPSLGFLGHWCGAVLVHQYWVLSAAHCVHNDLFNLPIPPLWTVVLGEHDRQFESGYEQRIPVEKIVLHNRYQNFLHDLVLMKLSMPADLTHRSNIRRICLPFGLNQINTIDVAVVEDDDGAVDGDEEDPLEMGLGDLPEKMDNFLRSAQTIHRDRNMTQPSMKDLMTTKIMNRLKKVQEAQMWSKRPRAIRMKRRRNDKLMRVKPEDLETSFLEPDAFWEQRQPHRDTTAEQEQVQDLPYVSCVATGWGKANVSGDLTDILLKTRVPLHQNRRCKEAYGSFVDIHRGHLCAGRLNGQGGTCVGDSGGPLQCRLSRNGPWILAGITSFGSGCAIEGFPDVYARTSFYMKWIQETIANE